MLSRQDELTLRNRLGRYGDMRELAPKLSRSEQRKLESDIDYRLAQPLYTLSEHLDWLERRLAQPKTAENVRDITVAGQYLLKRTRNDARMIAYLAHQGLNVVSP